MTTQRDGTRKTHAALARQVMDLSRARALRAGDHLAEQVFAGLCGVSRTPIRATFKILEHSGFVEYRATQGYFLAVDPEAVGASLDSQLDTSDGSLADRILADRLARRLEDVQSVSHFIRRYGVTRSAVLNALTILHQDGIIERVPGQAWGFRPILDTPGAIDDSLQFRLVLEPAAILAPGFALDQTRARPLRLQMQKALAASDTWIGAAAFHRQDTEFHQLIDNALGRVRRH